VACTATTMSHYVVHCNPLQSTAKLLLYHCTPALPALIGFLCLHRPCQQCWKPCSETWRRSVKAERLKQLPGHLLRTGAQLQMSGLLSWSGSLIRLLHLCSARYAASPQHRSFGCRHPSGPALFCYMHVQLMPGLGKQRQACKICVPYFPWCMCTISWMHVTV